MEKSLKKNILFPCNSLKPSYDEDMITIPTIEGVRFPTDWYFERTGNLRSSVKDCTREELVDLLSFFANRLSQIQGQSEKINLELEELIGFHDPLK